MNIFSDFTSRVKNAAQPIVIESGKSANTELDRINVEPPRETSHGDLATNAAMLLAKPLGQKPRELAIRIAATLAQDPDVDAAEVAGPGFINLRLRPAYWLNVLRSLVAAGEAYGRSNLGRGAKVNVEYVSANPTGPLHIGHCRGAVFGDALSNLLDAAGYAVTREYYINDGGAQVDRLAVSAHLRYRQARGEKVDEIPEGLYPGDYLIPVGQALSEEYGDSLREGPAEGWLPVVRDFTVARM